MSNSDDYTIKRRTFVTLRTNDFKDLLGHVYVHSQGQAGSIQWQSARGLQTHDCNGVTSILWIAGIIGFVTTHSDLKTKNKKS